VAGKTGTAQGAAGPQAWFVGFAPVDDPVIALAVIVEEGGAAGESGTGGSVAAPIAAQIIAAWLGGES
jgi:peptidoglycan glycosyltransferase